MKRTSTAVLGVLILSIVPASLFAKGNTVKITIKGGDLSTPLEIIDPKIAEFGIWQGPGTFRNGSEGTEGFIIDWPKGVVEQLPPGLKHYEVSFYTGCWPNESGCRTSEPVLDYVVSYDYDPSTQQGFVYLPGRSDPEFKYNYVMWHGHGLEGHWLRATSAWENFVRPLVARSRALSQR